LLLEMLRAAKQTSAPKENGGVKSFILFPLKTGVKLISGLNRGKQDLVKLIGLGCLQELPTWKPFLIEILKLPSLNVPMSPLSPLLQ